MFSHIFLIDQQHINSSEIGKYGDIQFYVADQEIGLEKEFIQFSPTVCIETTWGMPYRHKFQDSSPRDKDLEDLEWFQGVCISFNIFSDVCVLFTSLLETMSNAYAKATPDN